MQIKDLKLYWRCTKRDVTHIDETHQKVLLYAGTRKIYVVSYFRNHRDIIKKAIHEDKFKNSYVMYPDELGPGWVGSNVALEVDVIPFFNVLRA